MEVTGQGPSPPTSSAITSQPLQTLATSPNQSSAVRQVDPNNPDDPLAAIMNQTIFGGNFVMARKSAGEPQFCLLFQVTV